MTRAEILAFLRGNAYKRITHRLFEPDEYLYAADDGNIYDENDYLFEDWDAGSYAHNGMRMRTGGPWETDWEIVTTTGVKLAELKMPKNPLEEKWAKLYPPTPMPQYSQVCDGYSCMWCGRCPRGDNWKVPEEDREIWEQYQKELQEYLRATRIL